MNKNTIFYFVISISYFVVVNICTHILAQSKSIKKINCLQIIPNLGFGGVETGKNLHKYLNSYENTSVVLCQKFRFNL